MYFITRRSLSTSRDTCLEISVVFSVIIIRFFSGGMR
jgi:hypothetical protein